MGLISKIEDKLSGSSSEQNKLEKPHPGTDSNSSASGATSKLQHPISSSDGRPYGSAVDSRSEMPGGYESSSTGTSGNYGSNTSDNYGDSTFDKYGGRQTGSGMNSSTVPNNATSGSRSGYSGPQQPYDPYSSKGQQTAADAGAGTSQVQNFSRNQYDDPSIARSKHGGVVNQSEDPRYTSGTTGGHSHGTSSGQSHGTSSGTESARQPASTSQHHYGRDAAMAGGLGAGGIGAYEMGKDRDSRMTSQNPSSAGYTQSGTGRSTNDYDDGSYMNRSAGAGPISSGDQYAGRNPTDNSDMANNTASMGSTNAIGASGAGSSEPAGLTQAHKMGGAYEAGYRDAMEHMKAEMGKQ